MKIKSLNLFNLCVPCSCHCKHCLLSYESAIVGIDFNRGLKYAIGFKKWMDENHPDIHFSYYFGYSMETNLLFEHFDELKQLNSPFCSILQFNGLKKRNENELRSLLLAMKEKGIKLIDLTFYGLEQTHDYFADRNGDYKLNISILQTAKQIGLDIEIGIVLVKENILEIEKLITELEIYTKHIFIILPHCGGRGLQLQNSKISLKDYETLSEHAKSLLNRNKYKTQKEWKDSYIADSSETILSLSLLKSNIQYLESNNYETIFNELKKMDERFYTVIPSFKKLLEKYYDQTDDALYSMKDLYALFRKRFIKENNIDISDIDERYSYSWRL